MKSIIKTILAASAMAALAGCQSDSSMDTSAPRDNSLSGTLAQFEMMKEPCIQQASRMTGVHPTNIYVANSIRTGGGPLLILKSAGKKYSCRLEDDGSVTVFSEYAN
jgi:outer membrane murein-binding lipoprotein Lpp